MIRKPDNHIDPKVQSEDTFGEGPGELDKDKAAMLLSLVDDKWELFITYINIKIQENTPLTTLAEDLQIPLEAMAKIVQRLKDEQ